MLTKTESWKRRRTERRKDFPPIQFQSMVDTLFPTRTQKVIQPDDTTTARPLVNLQNLQYTFTSPKKKKKKKKSPVTDVYTF